MASTRYILEQLERQIGAVEAEVHALQRLQRTIGGDIVKQDDELGPSWSLLVDLLVSDLEPATLDAASKRVVLPAVSAKAIAQRRATIVDEARLRLRHLAADERLVNAEATLNEVDIGASELDAAIAPLETSTRLLEDTRLFLELLRWRYGTDEYSVKFWQLEYYRHWKHGDLVVEAHGPRLKKTDFKGIAALYVEEAQALNTLRQTRAALLEKRRQIEMLRQQIADTEAVIENADNVILLNARARVREQLQGLEVGDVFDLLREDEAATLAFKRIVGIKKKQEYLTALSGQELKASLADLHTRLSKLQRTHSKLMRPKYSHTQWNDVTAERMVGQDRSDKWRKRRAHYDDARTRIVEFHHYDRYDPVRDFLWWDVMTDGQLDGNFIDEVRDHRGAHYSFVNEHRDQGVDLQPAWRNDDLSDVS